MSELDELQRRITAALERIGQGLDAVAGAEDGSGEIAALTRELEAERQVSADLEARLQALTDEQAARSEKEAAARAEQIEGLRRLDTELQSLRKANQQLRENSAALREANASGVGDAELINTAMLGELEALSAAREADRAEAELIMADLTRLLDAADGAATTQTENA